MSTNKTVTEERKLIETAIQECDRLVAQGSTVEISWEGGNDSGWAELLVDGRSETSEWANALVELMDEEIDYGSWAGDFSASGIASYDPQTKCFTGIDSYCTDDDVSYNNFDLSVKVPAHLAFDRLDIELCYDEDADDSPSTVSLFLRNGIRTQEHIDTENEIKTFLLNMSGVIMVKFDKEFSQYSTRIDFEEQIARSEFTLVGDYLEYKIDNVVILYTQTQENTIVLDLKQYLDELH